MDQPPRRAIYPKGNTLAVLRRLFMEGLFHCTFAEFISSVCKLHLSCQISSLNSMFCNDVLKGIEYNSSTKGKYPNGKEIVSIGSTENCESEKWDTEVEKDKKVSFDNVTNAS